MNELDDEPANELDDNCDWLWLDVFVIILKTIIKTNHNSKSLQH